MKVLVLFPGQEAFYEGMCSEIAENYPEALGDFEVCKKRTGLDILKDCIYCESGKELTDEEKGIAVLAVSVSNYRILKQTYENIEPYFAGEGIGFLSALVCSQTISLREAIRLIKGKKPYSFLLRNHFEKVMLPSTGEPAQSKREIVSDIAGRAAESDTVLSKYMENAAKYEAEAAIDCGPGDCIAGKVKMLGAGIPCTNLDSADDPNYILEGFEYKKLFNRYYCSLRVLGIMSSCRNNNLSTDEYRAEILEHYQTVKAIVDNATMKLYQTGVMELSQEDFEECFERLDCVFRLKKISEEEIEKRLEKLEQETMLKIKELRVKRGDKAIAG